MIFHAIVGRQQLAQPDAVARRLERWLAEVAVDQKDPPLPPREILGNRQSGGRFAFARAGAGDQHYLVHPLLGAE
jgi:hypothetical protein